jgi:hypothetical protein
MEMPEGNIHWRDLPVDATIIEQGNHFEAKIGDETFVVYWGDRESVRAQRDLKRRAAQAVWKAMEDL